MHRSKTPGFDQTFIEEVKEDEEATPHGLHGTAPGAPYTTFVAELKQRITGARVFAARAVNGEIIRLYWDIGRLIAERQQVHGWGESIIDQLAQDLSRGTAGVRGFSARNLRDMKRFYKEYSDALIWRQAVAKLEPQRSLSEFWPQAVAKIGARDPLPEILRQPVAESVPKRKAPILQQPVAELETGTASEPQAKVVPELLAAVPWGHHLQILHKVDAPDARLYYLQAVARYGWTRAVLVNQIKADAHERARSESKAHNFTSALSERLAEQAEETLKSSYNLEFLGIANEIRERDLENKLLERLKDFILELGYGFCFIGRQHRLALGRKEYFIDLLFYHRFLKALVAVELKIGGFAPEHAGKMDFYLNLLNDKERGEDDNPSIGIILCAEKDNLEVEFALKSKTNPIGVAEYQLRPELPARYRGKLPTARQLGSVIKRQMSGGSG